MDILLNKVFATALALSLVTTSPNDVKTVFDPDHDEKEVVQILRNGCARMLKVFDIENLDIDELIVTAMKDGGAGTSEAKAFRGIKFDDLYAAYRQFCKNETVADSPFDARDVIEFY